MSEKNVPILHDTVSGGHIEAVRHANGRDWWVIVSQFNTNLYYMYYISPYGVELYRTQNIGNPTTYQTGLNQAVFSPDGTKYCRYNNIDDLFIFDFDRCEGVLSNFKYVEVNDTTIPGGPLVVNANGLSISPNSRYLYLSNGFDLMQYDLNSDDPAITRQDVAHYNLWANYEALVFSQLGPDGKIYITTGNGTRHMHIVHNPDEFGLACNPQISAIVFDVAKNNAPNMPNYRLGPVDGSTCDSLGLDNLPWAHWRWQPDTFALRTVLFRDLSAYEPTAWHWDFGDGGSSAEQHPAHTFPAPGDYTVCLVASNSFGADTFCRVVTVSAVGADEVFRGLRASLAPNPAQDHVGLRLSEPLARACRFELFDPSGRLALSESLAPGTVTARVDLPESLPAGLYFWRIVNGGRVLVAGRVVKALR